MKTSGIDKPFEKSGWEEEARAEQKLEGGWEWANKGYFEDQNDYGQSYEESDDWEMLDI